jgi:hypothetical protein
MTMNEKEEDMRKWSKSIQTQCKKSSLLAFVLIGLIAFQAGLFPAVAEGDVVPKGTEIPLVEGEKTTGKWQTSELAMDYTYLKNQNSMEISGEMRLIGGLVRSFDRIQAFHLRVYFLDAQGTVIKSEGVAAGPKGGMEEVGVFQKKLTLPPNTVAIAFGYRGNIVQKRGGDSPFWYVPTVK